MPYLSEIERGRKEASSEILAGICRALGIDLVDLLEDVRLELLSTKTAKPIGSAQGRYALSRSAMGRSAASRESINRGMRTPKLALCRTLSPTVSSSSRSY
ncbi:hypothetical protein GCM10010435_48550 [Winogradskya consettensis]|uniref:HTH cro/C1-type domain-containing protein n=1 Tax=Winogradskya consettensis TaxID=113560 RepID=A0A919SJY2_9ACTN|nr:hypothetical protein Aco04nite_33480 [Actinoplanes consettensis]